MKAARPDLTVTMWVKPNELLPETPGRIADQVIEERKGQLEAA